jgi:hypothetical protein
MKPLVDFIHSLGLKVGLYTDAGWEKQWIYILFEMSSFSQRIFCLFPGTETCVGHRPGSYGFVFLGLLVCLSFWRITHFVCFDWLCNVQDTINKMLTLMLLGELVV